MSYPAMNYVDMICPDKSSANEVAAILGVSTDVKKRLVIYAELLKKWQNRINLISKNTLPTLWERHILDSGQLAKTLPHHLSQNPLRIIDMGTGAGLPGLILAIMTEHEVHLVDSDTRKIAFLRTALRETGTKAILHEDRIENLPPLAANVITARALAPLDQLLSLAKHQHHQQIHYLFLKGKNAHKEWDNVSDKNRFKTNLIPSQTNNDSMIIHLQPKP